MFSSGLRLALALLAFAAPVPAAAHAEPKILGVVVSDPVFHRNQKTRWEVTTTPDVGAVTAEVQGRRIVMAREAPGRFALSFTVPWYVPWWYNKAWPLRFVARTADGSETTRTVTIELK